MPINWTPFTLSWDDHVPVDISFVFNRERPAGKHGFLAVYGDGLCLRMEQRAVSGGRILTAGPISHPCGQ